MRVRNSEINQRRQRYQKRRKLRKKLEAATTDQERQELMTKIQKTLPRYAPAS